MNELWHIQKTLFEIIAEAGPHLKQHEMASANPIIRKVVEFAFIISGIYGSIFCFHKVLNDLSC